MIKGIYFKKQPWMTGVTLDRVLSDLDYFKEPESKEVIDSSGYTMNLTQQSGSKFKVKTYESENEQGIEAIFKMYEMISYSLPEFIGCYRLSPGKVMMVYPNFISLGKDQEILMDLFIDELTRVSVISMKEYGDGNLQDITLFLQDYVDTCVYISEEE